MTGLKALAGSVTGKVTFIGLLILVLLIPLGMIEGLVHERSQLYGLARDDIGRSWGEAQIVGGPILVVPFSHTRPVHGQSVLVQDELYVLPERLEISGSAEAEERRRGIYEIPVYTTRLRATGTFAPVAFDGEYQDLQVRWDQAAFALPISDARSVREPIVLGSGDAATVFEAGGTRVPGLRPVLVAPYAAMGAPPLAAPLDFSFDLVLGGTGALRFLPLGDETHVTLKSNWPSPSFGGAFLPSERSVDAAGFTAEWRVLDLGRGYPSSWTRSDPPQTVETSAFGVELITPIGVHEAALRATKYGVLIIGFTFVAYFLFELFAALRLHALQYLLIGLANAVFYLLLLALAEHVGFGPAYAASAVASTALITSYSGAVLGALRRAVPISGLMTALYGYLYVTLKAEDYALLFGALGVFGVLAGFMYLTRHVDWFAVTFGAGGNSGPRMQLHA
jgi:inner membrane protein